MASINNPPPPLNAEPSKPPVAVAAVDGHEEEETAVVILVSEVIQIIPTIDAASQEELETQAADGQAVGTNSRILVESGSNHEPYVIAASALQPQPAVRSLDSDSMEKILPGFCGSINASHLTQNSFCNGHLNERIEELDQVDFMMDELSESDFGSGSDIYIKRGFTNPCRPASRTTSQKIRDIELEYEEDRLLSIQQEVEEKLKSKLKLEEGKQERIAAAEQLEELLPLSKPENDNMELVLEMVNSNGSTLLEGSQTADSNPFTGLVNRVRDPNSIEFSVPVTSELDFVTIRNVNTYAAAATSDQMAPSHETQLEGVNNTVSVLTALDIETGSPPKTESEKKNVDEPLK